MYIRNSASSTQSWSGIGIGNNLGITGYLWAGSDTYAGTVGQNRMVLESTATAAGLSLRTMGAGDIRFLNGSNERMRIDTSGRVAIGTTSTTANLEVQGSTGVFRVSNSTSADNIAVITSSSTTGAYMHMRRNGTNEWMFGSDPTINGLTFRNSNIANPPSVTFLTSGNVGIGTTAPNTKLSVFSTDSNFGTSVINSDSTVARYPSSTITNFRGATDTAGYPVYHLVNNRGTQGSQDAVQNGDWLGALQFWGGDSTTASSTNRGAQIHAIARETFTTTSGATDLVFSTTATGASDITERMRVTSGGNIGIGTTNPTSFVDVRANTSTQYAMRVDQSNASGNGYYSWLNSSGTNDAFRIDNTVGTIFKIQSNGNVGIGTTSPGVKLHINDTNTANTTVARFVSTNATYSGVSFTDAGTATSPGIFSNNDNLGLWTGGTQKVTVLSGGDVGIGTTNPADRLHVAGDARVGTGTTGCLKDADGTVLAGTCSSDARFKENIRPIGTVSERLSQLKPSFYFWKYTEFPEKHFGQEEEVGLIAQEVKEVFPNLVTIDKDGYYQVKYSDLNMYILGGVVEHSLQLKKHQQDLESLKARTHVLENSKGKQDRDLASLKSQKADKSELEALRVEVKAKNLEIQKLKQENAETKARLDKIEKMLQSK